jgi:predicted permease
MMRRAKGFTAAAVLSLAVGIGANLAIFSVVDALLLRTLDVKNPHELFQLNRTGFSDPNPRVSYPLFERFRAGVPSLRFTAMAPAERMQVAADGNPELVLGQLVSGEWFDVLGVGSSLGRVLGRSDDVGIGGHPVVVLSEPYWSRRFGSDPGILGRTITINGAALVVVGVSAQGFTGVSVGERVDVWIPTSMQVDVRHRGNASADDADESKPWGTQDGIQWLSLLVRVPAGIASGDATSRVEAVNAQNLQARVARIQNPTRRARMLREHVELLSAARGESNLRERFSQALVVLMSTVALVLLVACANLANLLLARNAARGQEFAVRLSLGARRGRIVRQLLTESLALALLGGAAGLVVARWSGLALLSLASSDSTPIPLTLTLDARLMGMAFAASVVTGMLFGLWPAIRLSRVDPHDAIKSGGRVIGAAERSGRWPASKLLVIAQVALSLILLVGGMLFLRTFRNLLSIDTGYDREHVVTARFDARLAAIDEKALPGLYDRLLAEAAKIPGMRSAGLALTGLATGSQRTSAIFAEGRREAGGEDDVVREDYIAGGYFSTVGMRLLRGRDFDSRDTAKSGKVAIVNEAMARHFFPTADAMGRRFGNDPPGDVEIIGIVADVKVDGLRESTPSMAYYPVEQGDGEYLRNMYVRVSGSPETVKQDLRRAITSAAPNLAVREPATLGEVAARTVTSERLVSQLTAMFSLLAVAVACLGLYGTVSYSVTRRTNEIGIRLALGASTSSIRWLVMRETLMLVVVGSVVGLGVLLPSVKVLASLLYGLSPRDPLTLVASFAMLVAVAVIAGAIPALRASRVNPTTALRGS